MHDIHIEIRLCNGARFDARTLIHAFDVVEGALYDSDRHDLVRAQRRLKLSPLAVDAALERLRRFRHRRFLVSEAREGSIVLGGVVAGVSFFVLRATLGEAFQDGVRETQLYETLKNYFRDTVDEKTAHIVERLRSRLPGRVRRFPEGLAERGAPSIVLEVTPAEEPESPKPISAELE